MCQPIVMMLDVPRHVELTSTIGPGSRNRRISSNGYDLFRYTRLTRRQHSCLESSSRWLDSRHVYYVEGNHETYVDAERGFAAVKQYGVNVLRNNVVET